MLKALRTSAMVIALTLAAAISPALAGAQAPPDTSPVITHTGTAPTGYTVTFRFYAPAATGVKVRGEWGLRSVASATTLPPSQYQPGDFFNEALVNEMTLDSATGVWSWTTPLPPGTWSYQFQPTPCTACPAPYIQDPANPTFNQVGSAYTGSYEPLSQVYVPRDAAFSPVGDGRPEQAPVPVAQRGKQETLRYTSPGTTTCNTVVQCSSPAGQHDIAVYTPPGYDPNRAVKYPTLYLSHGGGGNEIDWFTQGAANEIMDNLINSGRVQPLVVVATDFNGQPAINGSSEEFYARDLIANVFPLLESRYNISPLPNDRSFGGLSAGGARTGRLLFQYPETFGYYASWSSTGAFGPTIDMSNPGARTRLALHVGIGRQDPGVERHQGLARLATTDIPFTRDDVNGVHSWDVWRQLLVFYMTKVSFRHTTTAVSTSGTTATATVKNSTNEPTAPTGTVQFSAGGQPIGSPVPVVGGKATLTIPSTAGASSITATYSGDSLYNTSAATAAYAATSTTGTVGGTVSATLSLTLGTPASFGPFTPGTAKDYLASTTATVVSTAGDATLSVADPSSIATGRLVNGNFSLPQTLQAGVGTVFAPVGGTSAPTLLKSWTAPTSNESVTVAFKQPIAANDALRTGTYSKTLTFTLSTTQP
ncbi:Ig-like domain repeat protein [Solirubrobacter taibaiensis]|nr:Ig-like domain repeat protein [Solirubrobacter taibaiensis]